MFGIVNKPDTLEKLQILSADAQYDLACACGSTKDEHRKRGRDGKWIYPVTLPNGGTSVLFKTLVSNVCSNDCKYCPLRSGTDVRRCTLDAEQTASIFMDYYRAREVSGLFLSSGCLGDADRTMERLLLIAEILRKREQFKGYMHLKVIPGCSDAAVEQAVKMASAVSVNIEVPGQQHLAKLSGRKDFLNDIIRPIKLISQLTAKGTKFARVKQTTQFIVGAAGEKDAEIVKYMWGLYKRLNLNRVYFSAYQKGLGQTDMPGEQKRGENAETFTREHRLYQVDFLMRKYGFELDDILFDDGQLSLNTDPKMRWAQRHPEFFPVHINYADKNALLKVPGLGPITVNRILKMRRCGRIRSIEDIAKPNTRLLKANTYLSF